MSLSRRDRRKWRIFLWVNLATAVVSAFFGYAIRPPDSSPLVGALSGVVTSG